MKKFLKIIICLLLLFFSVAIGYIIGTIYEHNKLVKSLSIISPLREHNPKYKFIDPLLAYIIPSADQEEEFRVLKNKIAILISNEKGAGTISNASVFLSDLNRGRWIGINENQKYNPASILKVVIMVTYFKEKETNQIFLIKN